MASRSPRAMASLESGPVTCATAIAVTRSRCRDGAGSISSSRPRARSEPSTAATCPCGRLRVISNAPSRAAAGGWPFSTRDRASTLAPGQADRLARVRFFTFPASR